MLKLIILSVFQRTKVHVCVQVSRNSVHAHDGRSTLPGTSTQLFCPVSLFRGTSNMAT